MAEKIIILANFDDFDDEFKSDLKDVKEFYFVEKKLDTGKYIDKNNKPTEVLYEIAEEIANDRDVVYLAIHLGGKPTIEQYKELIVEINKNIKKDLKYTLYISYYGSGFDEFNLYQSKKYKKIVEKIKYLVGNEPLENAEQIKFFYTEQKESLSKLIETESNDSLKKIYTKFICKVYELEEIYEEINKNKTNK